MSGHPTIGVTHILSRFQFVADRRIFLSDDLFSEKEITFLTPLTPDSMLKKMLRLCADGQIVSKHIDEQF